MNGYVLKRIEDGKYVNWPGSHSSYVKDIRQARLFETREAAEQDRCGNEVVLPFYPFKRRGV